MMPFSWMLSARRFRESSSNRLRGLYVDRNSLPSGTMSSLPCGKVSIGESSSSAWVVSAAFLAAFLLFFFVSIGCLRLGFVVARCEPHGKALALRAVIDARDYLARCLGVFQERLCRELG